MTTASQKRQQGRSRSPPTPAPSAGRVRLRLGPRRPQLGRRPGPGLRQQRRSTGSATCAGSASCRRPAARARMFGADRPEQPQPRRTSRSARWPARQTVTRTVTNVDPAAGDLRARRRRAGAGVTVTVSPRVLLVRAGGTASYRVTFTRTSAAFGEYAFGSLTWTNGLFTGAQPAGGRPGRGGRAGRGERDRHLRLGRDRRSPGLHRHADDRGRTGWSRRDVRTPALQATGPGFDPAAPAASTPDGEGDGHDPGRHHGRPALHLRRRLPGRHGRRPVPLRGRHRRPGGQQRRRAPPRSRSRSRTRPRARTTCTWCCSAAAPGQTGATVPTYMWALRRHRQGQPDRHAGQPGRAGGQPVTVTAAWSGLTAGQRYLGRVRYGDGTEVGGTAGA